MIIEENGLGIAYGNDVEKIKEGLKELLVRKSTEKISLELLVEKLKKYTRGYQAQKMLNCLDQNWYEKRRKD